jgi:molecular chaperone DnaK
MGRLLGIDLGTTNSCAVVLDGGEPKVIPNETGAHTTPSIVAYQNDGTFLVGDAAKRQAILQPTSTIAGIKRLIGRRFDSAPVSVLKSTLPYSVVDAGNGEVAVRVGARNYSPPEISANVLRHLKLQAEKYFCEPADRAIITVPAYFDDAQRRATKDAGVIAGLEVLAILNEPTAAALAYGIHKNPGDNLVAVFDLGGGTFDVSILRIEDSVFEVLATSGDTFLGGDDFDRAMSENLLGELKLMTGATLGKDPAVAQRLKIAVETAKHELSSTTETEINLPFVGAGPSGPVHLARTIDRRWLEELSKPFLERLRAPCNLALHDAGIMPEQLDHLLLVGGMTRMPAVRQAATAIFKKPPAQGVNPDEIVAVGAATHAGIMSGAVKEAVLVDVTPHTLGIRVFGDRVSPIIKRNSSVPLRQTKMFATTENEQTMVIIEVLEGESAHASGNRPLGKFMLGDLPKKPMGEVQVKVSFSLDADGILNVEAVEASTGKATSKKFVRG